jgi:hypothetical protein
VSDDDLHSSLSNSESFLKAQVNHSQRSMPELVSRSERPEISPETQILHNFCDKMERKKEEVILLAKENRHLFFLKDRVGMKHVGSVLNNDAILITNALTQSRQKEKGLLESLGSIRETSAELNDSKAQIFDEYMTAAEELE